MVHRGDREDNRLAVVTVGAVMFWQTVMIEAFPVTVMVVAVVVAVAVAVSVTV